MPTFRQAASEILVFMLLTVETVAEEEVDVSMEGFVEEGVEEEVDKVEEDTSEEVEEGSAVHMEMELTY